MPIRRSCKSHSPGTQTLVPCSHTREVTDTFLDQFYFSSASRKKTCPQPRPQTSAVPGEGLLRASRLT
jgi:hypothetical protein